MPPKTSTAPLRLAVVGLWALVCGCGAPTSLRVEVSMQSGAPSPEMLRLSVFDPRGSLVRDHLIASPQLPGQLIVRVADTDQMLRIALSSPTGRGSARVTVRAHEQSRAVVILSAGTPDSDGDQVPDEVDNCVGVPNPDQADRLGSGQGDACRQLDGGVPDLNEPDLSEADLSEPDLSLVDLSSTDSAVDLASNDLAVAACPVGAQLCEDFEAATIDTTRWSVGTTGGLGTLQVDTTRPRRGVRSLHIHLNAAGGAAGLQRQVLGLNAKLVGNTSYVRLFAYASALPAAFAELINESQTAAGAKGVTFNWDGTNTFVYSSYGTPPPFASATTGVKMTAGTWTCLEFAVDAPAGGATTGSVKAWKDDMPLSFISNFGITPAIDTLSIGVELPAVPAGTPAIDLWIDSVVVSGTRVGCTL